MSTEDQKNLSRRNLLAGASGALASAALMSPSLIRQSHADQAAKIPCDQKRYVANKGNINHSAAYWNFNQIEVEGQKKISEASLAGHAKKMGAKSVELLGPANFKMLANEGLVCALSPNGMSGPPFMRGWNNLDYHQQLKKVTRHSIDACAEYKFPNVIAFNGYKYREMTDHTKIDSGKGEISLEEGFVNCVKGLKSVASYAEKKGVTIVLEHLNTRDNSHPMKGHPGYQGDDIDYCAAIVNAVGSSNVKLLFDVYHVSIMNGDIIRRINQYKDIIGHYHTAGNPGRGELDLQNEINYDSVMKTIAETNYKGYVGHEFIPVRVDKMLSLNKAIEICDV